MAACSCCLTPLELIDRLAALIPPPCIHRHCYHGVLPPDAPVRAQVTALARQPPALELRQQNDVPLGIKLRKDGPLRLDGPCEVRAPDGTPLFRAVETALCRCGQSSKKPLCDGTHRTTRLWRRVRDHDSRAFRYRWIAMGCAGVLRYHDAQFRGLRVSFHSRW
jgi:hypothetical protein